VIVRGYRLFSSVLGGFWVYCCGVVFDRAGVRNEGEGDTFFEEEGSRLRFFGALVPGMAEGEAMTGKVFAADQRPNRDTLILGACNGHQPYLTNVNTRTADSIKFGNVKYYYGDL
jgi:hypothetical protein